MVIMNKLVVVVVVVVIEAEHPPRSGSFFTSYDCRVQYLFYYSFKISLRSQHAHLLVDFFQNLSLFLGTVQDVNR